MRGILTREIPSALELSNYPQTSIWQTTYIHMHLPFDPAGRGFNPWLMQMKAPVLPRVIALSLLAATFPPGLRAQVQVSSVVYSALSNGANVAADNITYANDYNKVDYIDTANGNYVFANAPGAAVTIRRSTATNNNATVFYQYSGAYSSSSDTVYAKGDVTPTVSEVMLSSDLTQGLRNPFANKNGGVADVTTTNIERIDFSLPSFTVTNVNDGFVFFDLENYGNNGDGFRIAAYTATGTVNGIAGSPTTYANTGLLVAAGSFGTNVAAPTGGDVTYMQASTSYGDNLYNSPIATTNQVLASIDTSSDGTLTSSDLVLVGILVRFSDLGLAVNDVIQGYSLISSDTVVTTAASLVDWRNAAVYLTNTEATSSAGNMDFMGFGAQISRYVPEPSTYGLMFSGAACALAGWRRLRRKAATA